MPGELLLLKTVKRTPSKRTRPSEVANQRYPSRAWWMAWMEFCGKPLSAVQESKRNWAKGVAEKVAEKMEPATSHQRQTAAQPFHRRTTALVMGTGRRI